MRSLLVSPIEPLPTGNGLAMRAGMWLDSLARYGDVDLAVIPLAGDLAATAWADDRSRRRWRFRLDPADAISTLADPHWRAEMAALEPRPQIATSSWPGTGMALAEEVLATGSTPEVVVGFRSYVGPVAAAAARQLGVRLVVDLDDDDLAMAPEGEKDSWARLVGRVGEWADELAAASAHESSVMSRRLGRSVTVLPNVVQPVSAAPPRTDALTLRLLFVGNLTYGPNRDAVSELVDSIIPRLEDAHLTLVGTAHDEDVRRWTEADSVDHLGWVDDLAPVYESADVVVVPIRKGGGTRIKVLEAMAHGRPVVATTRAVAGLGLGHGRHALIADGIDDLIEAVQSLRDTQVASTLVVAAARHVRRRHHPDRAYEVVGRLIGAVD